MNSQIIGAGRSPLLAAKIPINPALNKTAEDREVPRELGSLCFAVEQLEAAVGALAEQLEPALMPPAPQAGQPIAECGGPVTSVGQRIANSRIRITALQEQVQELRGRVQI